MQARSCVINNTSVSKMLEPEDSTFEQTTLTYKKMIPRIFFKF